MAHISAWAGALVAAGSAGFALGYWAHTGLSLATAPLWALFVALYAACVWGANRRTLAEASG